MSDELDQVQRIEQAVAGERAALSALLLMHYDDLRMHIVQRLKSDPRNLPSPDDVLQDTFVRVAKSIRNYQHQGPNSFLAWLKMIATNLIRDAQRRRRLERRISNQAALAANDDDSCRSPLSLAEMPEDATSPSRRARRRESLRRMRSALNILTSEQRDVIERYYLQNQSLDQIAESLGHSKEAIRGVCYRARRSLRAVMGRTSLFFTG